MSPRTDRPRRRLLAAWFLLALATLLGVFVVSVSYGLSVEYADTGPSYAGTALRALDATAGVAVLVVAAVALGAARVGRGSRPVTSLAAVVVAAVLVGVPVGAGFGAYEKYQRFPTVPDCVSELTGGPALPVVRAAQAVFDELEHPAPFSGGGSSGVDGCSSELMVRDGTDPRPAYRRELRGHGWQVTAGPGEGLSGTRGEQRLELTRDDGSWWVWVGPARLRPRELPEGQVAPRD